MAGIGLTADEYAATYSQVIRIMPSHYLGWHGRSIPQSARVAGAPTDLHRGAADRPAGPPRLARRAPQPAACAASGSGCSGDPGAAGALAGSSPRQSMSGTSTTCSARNQTWSSWRRRTSPISRSLEPQSSALLGRLDRVADLAR